MKSNTTEALLGTSVILAAVAFFTFAYVNSGLQNDHTQDYFAIFDRVDGVQIGGDVKLSGVKVGTIHKITLDPKTFLAKINVSIQNDIKLPIDSSAEIVSDGLLGGKYLALIPGGDDETLKSGSQIVYTQSSVSLESMIGQLIFDKKGDKSKDKSTSSIVNQPQS